MRKSTQIKVLFDVRLANHAGIGRYGSQLLTALHANNSKYSFSILGPTESEKMNFELPASVKANRAFTDRYTFSELFEISARCFIPSHALFHSTNYVAPFTNIPSIVTVHDVMRLRLPEYCHSNAEFIRRFGYRKFSNILLISFLQTIGAGLGGSNLLQKCKSLSLTDTNSESLTKRPKTVFKFHHLYLLAMHKKALKNSTAIVTSSHFSKSEILSIFGSDLEKKICVIYPGVSSSFYRVSELEKWKIDNVITKFKLQDGYFLHVGLKRRHKNLHMLIDAYADALGNLGTSNMPLLLFVGKIDEDAIQLKVYATLKGISNYVRFLDGVNDEELNLLYNGSIALLFPSVYEGFGFPVIEAMACGIPVVAADGSSISEISNNSAILLNPYHKEVWTKTILQLCFDFSLRKELGVLGLRNARRFTWNRTASETFALYEQVLRSVTGDP